MKASWVWPERHDYPGFDAMPPQHTAHVGQPIDTAQRGLAVANLIIPDYSNPTGWREWWVYRNPPPVEPRKLGWR